MKVDLDLGNSRLTFSNCQNSISRRKRGLKAAFAEFVEDYGLSPISLLYGISITEVKGK